MSNFFNKIKLILALKKMSMLKYFHDSARICKRSSFDFPVYVGKNCKIKKSKISRYTYLSTGTSVYNTEIGRYCSIGPNCTIGGIESHPTHYFSTSPIVYDSNHPISKLFGSCKLISHVCDLDSRVKIGSDVWIGTNVLISSGTKIGNGAIIGANTFVCKDVPDYAVFYGSPPKVHRYRFRDEIIDKLSISQWWNLDPNNIDSTELSEMCR
jgi:acetyltransferase-like isoleucine patch superfamily enzyme